MAQIRVKIVSNTTRKTAILDDGTKIKQALADESVNVQGAIVNLDGSALSATEMGKTFAEMGVDTECTLAVVIKTENR